jgi:hypothetical protein
VDTRWRHDTQYNSIQLNDIRRKSKHEAQHNIARCWVLIVSFIRSVAFFNVLLNAVMPSVVILSGMVLIVVATLTGQCL